MTWLPISLKNAAKCDKWYQLQNHSITESLNANGAWEKPLLAIPVHAVSLSVEQKPNFTEESWLVVLYILESGGQVVIPSQPSNRRFMGNAFFHVKCFRGVVCRVQQVLALRAASPPANNNQRNS